MTSEPIPAVAAHVLDLFHGPLAQVRFPDVDRELLDADATAVRDAATAVRQAEVALGTAKEALDGAQRALRDRAQRALSYARIFAETRPDLAAAIGGSVASEGCAALASRDEPTRRRRPRRVQAEVTELLPDLAAE